VQIKIIIHGRGGVPMTSERDLRRRYLPGNDLRPVPSLEERPFTPAVPSPAMPPRVTSAGQVLHPADPRLPSRRANPRRLTARPPLIAAYDDRAGAWTEADSPVCVARLGEEDARPAGLGELCGVPAEFRAAGVDLCPRHFLRLEEWKVEAARAEEIRRESAELRRAASELEAAAAGYERIAREAEARWERATAARSVVYYLRRTSDGMIKIGTSGKFRPRLGAHLRAHGELQLLLTHAGSFSEETKARDRFRLYQVGRSEWFYPARPVLDWIRRARLSYLYAGIQFADVLPIGELRRLVRAAPPKKDLVDKDGNFRWPDTRTGGAA
jgi:hypothetical protein